MAEHVVRISWVVMAEGMTGMEGNPPTDLPDRMLAAFAANVKGQLRRREFGGGPLKRNWTAISSAGILAMLPL